MNASECLLRILPNAVDVVPMSCRCLAAPRLGLIALRLGNASTPGWWDARMVPRGARDPDVHEVGRDPARTQLSVSRHVSHPLGCGCAHLGCGRPVAAWLCDGRHGVRNRRGRDVGRARWSSHSWCWSHGHPPVRTLCLRISLLNGSRRTGRAARWRSCPKADVRLIVVHA